MKRFTIQRAYLCPIYQNVTVEADSLEDACATALAHDDWDGDAVDYESSGETYVDGAWEGEEAFEGDALNVPEKYQMRDVRAAPLNAARPMTVIFYVDGEYQVETFAETVIASDATDAWLKAVAQAAAKPCSPSGNPSARLDFDAATEILTFNGTIPR